MSYTRRKIDVTISLGSGNFGEGTGDTVTLSGLRVSAHIVKAALPATDSAVIKIYGVPLSIMNQVSRLGKPIYAIRDNAVTLSAGDDVAGLAQVFFGTIYSAYGDFGSLPESCLTITALNGYVDLGRPVPALSYPHGADVATICTQIAATMGQSLVNHGVSTQLASGYFPGTPIDQLRAVALAANIYAIPGGGPGGQSVEIWPKDGERAGLIPLISPDTGLIGYPRYSDYGIALMALYNPGLVFGAPFDLATSITPANGRWIVYELSYDLDAEMPGGKWFMNIGAYLPPDRGGAMQP